MKFKLSNNKLIEKYYEWIDFPREKAWDVLEATEGDLCTLCSTVIEGDRNDLVAHLYIEHKAKIKEDLTQNP